MLAIGTAPVAKPGFPVVIPVVFPEIFELVVEGNARTVFGVAIIFPQYFHHQIRH